MIADRPGVRHGGPAVARHLGMLRFALAATLVAVFVVAGCGAAAPRRARRRSPASP